MIEQIELAADLMVDGYFYVLTILLRCLHIYLAPFRIS